MSDQLKQYSQIDRPQKQLIDQVTQYSEHKEAIEANQVALGTQGINLNTPTQDDQGISPPIEEEFNVT